MFCPSCGLMQPSEHRFCASCGLRLPREGLRKQGPKISRWFAGIPVHPGDDPTGMLRVSRYLDEFEIETDEGSVQVPSHHVRFSVWTDDQATCAVSIPDSEAEALADFLLATVRNGDDQLSVRGGR
jgi:hypothetical protein